MRHLLFGLAVLCLAGVLTGCQHIAGICDCEYDEDRCCRHAPWANGCCDQLASPTIFRSTPASKEKAISDVDPLKVLEGEN